MRASFTVGQKLEEIKPRKRKSTGTRDKSAKRARTGEAEDEPKVIRFWDREYIEELGDLALEDPFELKTFLKKLMQKRVGFSGDDIKRGFELVVRGVDNVSADAVNQFITHSGAQEVMNRALKDVQTVPVGELGEEQLVSIFMATGQSTKSAVTQRTMTDIHQNLICSMSAVQFAIRWQSYDEGKHKNTNIKQQVIQATFRQHEGLAPDARVNTKSKDYKQFNYKHRAYVCGANRLLRAYKLFGSLMLVCPQLSLSYFRNTTTGPKLCEALTDIDNAIAFGSKRDLIHSELVQLIIQSTGSQALSKVFGNLEEVIEDVTPVVELETEGS
ncbi:hypothetical protein FRC07_013735 [Ceratobasidium sp. 392]|nr:hypothetical protein FRC07_013735 [Ceratobasidium sp. 392]